METLQCDMQKIENYEWDQYFFIPLYIHLNYSFDSMVLFDILGSFKFTPTIICPLNIIKEGDENVFVKKIAVM